MSEAEAKTEADAKKTRNSLRQQPTPLAYRLQDAGNVIGVGKSKLYELIDRDIIEARKLDGATVIFREELERYLSTLPRVKPERPANMGDGDGR